MKEAVKAVLQDGLKAVVQQKSMSAGPVDWNAVVDAVPSNLDTGSETHAFEKNLKKERLRIEKSAADELAFDNKVAKERQASKEAAEAKVQDDKMAVQRSLEADAAAIRAALDKRLAVQANAVETVNQARVDWEAHSLKKRQAEAAAIRGRMLGATEGEAEAHQKVVDWKEHLVNEAAEKLRAEEKALAAKRLADKRAAIDHVTALKEAADKAYAARFDAAARAVEAKSKANAGVEEDLISGSDGMKDTLLEHIVNRIAKEYARRAWNDQQRIDEAATAAWPRPE